MRIRTLFRVLQEMVAMSLHRFDSGIELHSP